MRLEELKDKKILILGFGVEGKATLAFLKHHFPDMVIGTADKNDGLDYLQKQKDYDLVIKSPGISKRFVTIPYTTATNIFFANVKGTTIGVTGSKGKSTTAALIYEILKQGGKKAHLVGNIGNPLLSELLKSNTEDDIFVCELSSFQLDDIKYSPHISVMLNLFPEHMDYHTHVKNYYEAKKRILAKAKSTDYFVYNPLFAKLRSLAKQTKTRVVPFVDALQFDRSVIPLLGEHNYDNVRAAVTVAKLFDIQDRLMRQAVQWFKPLNHRLELVGTFKGVTFYDDAIATIPEATIAAIQSLKNVGTILLGGQDRGYDFGELVDVVVRYNIPNVVFFPESGKKLRELLEQRLILRKGSTLINTLETESMEEAVKFAYEHTPKGSISLLSSASPSFSLWKNFEEKGELFQKFVKEYGK